MTVIDWQKLRDLDENAQTPPWTLADLTSVLARGDGRTAVAARNLFGPLLDVAEAAEDNRRAIGCTHGADCSNRVCQALARLAAAINAVAISAPEEAT